MSAYQRWRFELPSDQEELFSVELWSRGALGIETDDGFGGARAAPGVARRESGLVRLTAWFEDPPPAGLPHRSSAWRGRGAGSKLLHAGVEAARAFGCERLYVYTDVPKFFERHGWRQIRHNEGTGMFVLEYPNVSASGDH